MNNIIPSFGRLDSSLNGSAPAPFARNMLNFRLDGRTLRPRRGFTGVVGGIAGGFTSHGLGYVTNSLGVSEFLGVETHAGVTNPYRYDPNTLVRTAIGTPPALAGGDWNFVSFADNSYFINPGGTKTVWKHEIGNNASFTAVEDTAYTPPPSDAILTLGLNGAFSYPFAAGDTWTYTSSNGIQAPVTFAALVNGDIVVTAQDNDNGVPFRAEFVGTLAAVQDWSSANYIVFEVKAGTILRDFIVTNLMPQVRTGGVWRNTEYREYVSSDGLSVCILVRIKGVTGINAIQGVRFTIGGTEVGRVGVATACTIKAVVLGGTYLEASASGDRIWDAALDGNGITYGTRRKNGAIYTTLNTQSITRLQGHGLISPSYGRPIGGRIFLSTPAIGAEPDIEFLRLMEDGATWKVLATVPNSGNPQVQDIYEEHELAALPTAVDTGSVTVQPTPTFRTAGIRNAFAYKQSIFWLTDGGVSNVQISRVGNPEELFSVEAVYDADDLTQPASRTLSDNQEDRPMWGTQAGMVAFIVGERSAYSLFGDFPSTMSPSRAIPGSRGLAGYKAGTRMRPSSGSYGIAYADPDLNIWFVGSVPLFEGDSNARPVELSSPIKNTIYDFLYTEQKPEFATLDVSQTIVEFKENDNSLWVILGRRAACYRQDSAGNGWEYYQYRLTSPPGETTISSCGTFNAEGASISELTRSGATDQWSMFAQGLVSDDMFGTSVLGPGDKTWLLRANGYAPTPLIPASATIDSVSFQVEHKKSGQTWVDMDEAFMLISGVRSGVNRAAAGDVPSVESLATAVITTGLPTVAQLNAGLLGYEIGYTADPSSATKYNAGNWTITATTADAISVIGVGTVSVNPTITITATYTGALPAPKVVYVNQTLTATGTYDDSGPPVQPTDYIGNASANVFSSSDSGTIEAPTTMWPATRTVTGTQLLRIPMTGTVGTITVNPSASSTVTPRNGSGNKSWAFVTIGASAVIAPTPSAISVDSIRMRVCYTVTNASPGVTSGVSWQSGHFTGDSKTILIRSTGQIDIIEQDFRSKRFIVGSNRDSGYPMPNAFWESQNYTTEGGRGKFVGMQIVTETVESMASILAAQVKTDEIPYTDGTKTGDAFSRWYTFGPSVNGNIFSHRFTAAESLDGVEGLSVNIRPVSKGKPI